MYQPQHFKVGDLAQMHAHIGDNALAVLVTVMDGELEVNHVPVVLDADVGPYGQLRFHLARANPLAAWLSTSAGNEREVICVLRGEQAYVSPDWYHTENMVPTWNYAVVHAHGRPQVLDDHALMGVLDTLSAAQEQRLDKPAWTTKNMDPVLFEKMRRAIVGFRMPIARLEGKWKMSQNRPDSAREGVISALGQMPSDNSAKTAATMRELLHGAGRDTGS